MKFSDILGQTSVIRSLKEAVISGKLPHALLLCGEDGRGSLAIAHALAQFIVCQHKTEDGEPCGVCPECIQAAKLGHPDIHWVFPVINRKDGGKDASVSDEYLAEWRQAYLANPDITLPEWIQQMAGDDKKQAHIFVSEAMQIVKTLSTKPYESDYRVLILWLPEKMKEDTANKLLKIIEEPYEKTFFLLVSNNPEQIIGTIQSRTQRIVIPPIDDDAIHAYLQAHYDLPAEQLKDIARMSHGSVTEAQQLMSEDEEHAFFFDMFCKMMRSSYSKKLFEMKQWSDEMAAISRERSKNFFQYSQRLIRENFIMNLRNPELNYMSQKEREFSQRFSPFVNMRNVEGIMEELSKAETDIVLNGNAKMIYFDLSLHLIMLLKNGNPANQSKN